MAIIRRCRNDERDAIYTIVNSAEAYRDVIPADRRHDTCRVEELDAKIADGRGLLGIRRRRRRAPRRDGDPAGPRRRVDRQA
jgi:hypothetical protein